MTNKIEYAEVLIRGYRGIEETDKILRFVSRHDITESFDLDVFEKALSIMSNMDRLEYPIGINLCPATISKEKVVEKIATIMKRYAIKSSQLIIEINEGTDFTNKNVIENIEKLHKLGIRLALDDFGVEKANLYALLKFKFDILKIDKSFIGHESEESKNKILTIIKSLCDEFKMKSVVEGVEDTKQLENINKLGYTIVQGFIYNKPIPFVQFANQ